MPRRQMFINLCTILLHLYIIPIWQLFFCFVCSQTKASNAILEKNEKQKMEESFGLGKKSYDPKTDTETWS